MWIDDEVMCLCHEALVIKTWVPADPLVVLGSSNKAATEVDVEACAKARVPIMKRYGGGGTVVLHAGCVVVSIGAWVAHQFDNSRYFDLFNRIVIAALAAEWREFAALSQAGISDITLGNQKVAGTSLFRSRSYLLYQASILVNPELDLIERFLRHPSKEPHYRQGRSHRQFLTGLASLVSGLQTEVVAAALSKHLNPVCRNLLPSELVEPDLRHREHLLKRCSMDVS